MHGRFLAAAVAWRQGGSTAAASGPAIATAAKYGPGARAHDAYCENSAEILS